MSDNILPDERSDSFANVNGKYLWNAELLNDYKNKLSSNSVQNQLQDLNDRILISTDHNGINSYLSDFNEILSNVCTPFLRLIIQTLVVNMMKSGKILGLTKTVKKTIYIFAKIKLIRANKDAESRMAMTKASFDCKKKYIYINIYIYIYS